MTARARVGRLLRRWADRIDPAAATPWWKVPIGSVDEVSEDEHGLTVRGKLFATGGVVSGPADDLLRMVSEGYVSPSRLVEQYGEDLIRRINE